MIENLLDLTIATQAVLRFAVRPEPLQARIPAPWQVAADPSGVSKGANLAVTFNDALVKQDAAGTLTADAVSRYIGFAIPAWHPRTEGAAGVNFRILTAHHRAIRYRYEIS